MCYLKLQEYKNSKVSIGRSSAQENNLAKLHVLDETEELKDGTALATSKTLTIKPETFLNIYANF